MYKVVICKILLLTMLRLMRSDEGLSHILPNKEVFNVAPKDRAHIHKNIFTQGDK